MIQKNRPGKPAKKCSQASRLHDTIRLLESRHGITLDEIVEASGVGRRTVHRDLNAIPDAGYPLTELLEPPELRAELAAGAAQMAAAYAEEGGISE